MTTKLFVLAILLAIFSAGLSAQTVAYDAVPNPLPPNYVSEGFQCCATSEFGDQIILSPGTPRTAGFATVGMSSWTLHSSFPAMPAVGYTHPITLNIYSDAVSARAHAPMATVTQTFVIPWRPEADPTCPGGTAWRAGNGNCYNGFAFTIEFDLRYAGPGGSTVQLPDGLIFGIAYNTQTWGYNPIGLPGPYESLNVGLNVNPPTVGGNVELDAVYWNTSFAPFYTDGGASGVGVFRRDTAWAPYTPAIRFVNFASVANADQCKNGGWQILVRADLTPFKNQGDCVSYVKTGK